MLAKIINVWTDEWIYITAFSIVLVLPSNQLCQLHVLNVLELTLNHVEIFPWERCFKIHSQENFLISSMSCYEIEVLFHLFAYLRFPRSFSKLYDIWYNIRWNSLLMLTIKVIAMLFTKLAIFSLPHFIYFFCWYFLFLTQTIMFYHHCFVHNIVFSTVITFLYKHSTDKRSTKNMISSILISLPSPK